MTTGMGSDNDETLLTRLLAGELAPDAAEVLTLFARRPDLLAEYRQVRGVELRLGRTAALDRAAFEAAELEVLDPLDSLRFAQPPAGEVESARLRPTVNPLAAEGVDADVLAGVLRAESAARPESNPPSAGRGQVGGGRVLTGPGAHDLGRSATRVDGSGRGVRGPSRMLTAAAVLLASGGLAVIAWQTGWFGGTPPLDPGARLSGDSDVTIVSRVPARFEGRYTAFEWQCNAPTVASYDLTFFVPPESSGSGSAGPGAQSTALGAPWVLLEPRFEPDAAYEASLPDLVEFEIVARDAQRKKLTSLKGSTRRGP
jgi:hypothetical protein